MKWILRTLIIWCFALEKKNNAKFVGTFKLAHSCERYPADVKLTKAKHVKVNLLLDYFLVLGNYATMGHKLQGKTIGHVAGIIWPC